MLTSLPLPELLEAFSSSEPTPGGGSAAALAGALGASLMAMVAGLPKTRTGAAEERAELDHARGHLLELQQTLLDLVDRDAAAYDLVVSAYRRPKGTEEEKAARAAEIQQAMRIATEVPLETMVACGDVLKLSRVVADHGNPSARSDIAVAVQLLMTALQGGGFNVEVNIGSLKDPALVASITAKMKQLITETATNVRHIYLAGGVIEMIQEQAQRMGLGFRHPGQ